MLKQTSVTASRLSSRIAAPLAAPARFTKNPRHVLVKSHGADVDKGDNSSFSSDAMQTLSLRIAKLKYVTDASDRVSRACTSVDLEQVLSKRPELPEGVTVWEEVKADHQLIVEWHEQQWAMLGETVDEY